LRFAASRLLGHRPYPFGSKGAAEDVTSPVRQPQFAGGDAIAALAIPERELAEDYGG
jgi:hypothetical protein